MAIRKRNTTSRNSSKNSGRRPEKRSDRGSERSSERRSSRSKNSQHYDKWYEEFAPKHQKQKDQGDFHFEFKNKNQKRAWDAFQRYDVLFLIGPAGTGKSYLASAFAAEQVLNGKKDKIVLTRPIVESGESLGYLPGEFEEKVHPYMLPLYDCMDDLCGGKDSENRDLLRSKTEIAPIAYMRGRTFKNATCIFDEAQNATWSQLKLFLTRFGENSKIIITGDPNQSDIGGRVALMDVVKSLEGIDGIGVIEFDNSGIVRHPLVGKILERMGD